MWLELVDNLIIIASLLTPLALLTLGATMLLTRYRSEKLVHVLLSSTFLGSLILVLGAGFGLFMSGESSRLIDLGPLIQLGSYHLELVLLVDPLSIIMLTLNFILCGVVGYFSSKYLHRDEGYYRFFMMMLFLATGVELAVIAAGFDVMFIGWELLGISSALLVAFFYRRQAPTQNAFWTYGIYRLTDIGLLSAIIALHHATDDVLMSNLGLLGSSSLVVGALFIFGAMGKGGLFPFTGWLPRAMEGPTSSSAIFYGALSVHMSPFLLLRLSPLIEAHKELQIAIAALGVLTLLHASMVGRVQTDAKSTMAYASAAQIGIMWVWVALGWYELTIIHMVGHAIARSWQILRAPSFIQERRILERMQGARVNHDRHVERFMPAKLERFLYHIALQRWFTDDFLLVVVHTLKKGVLWINSADTQLFQALTGSDKPATSTEEESSVEIQAKKSTSKA